MSALDDGEPDGNSLQKMPYLGYIIKESQRFSYNHIRNCSIFC